jgi:hypothetical protein
LATGGEPRSRSRDVSQRAADWLVTHGYATRAVVASLTPPRTAFKGVAGAGVQPQLVQRLFVPLDRGRDLLVSALMSGRPASFSEGNGGGLPATVKTLFSRSSFTVAAIGPQQGDGVPAAGVLLVSPASDPLGEPVRWVAEMLG